MSISSLLPGRLMRHLLLLPLAALLCAVPVMAQEQAPPPDTALVAAAQDGVETRNDFRWPVLRRWILDCYGY